MAFKHQKFAKAMPCAMSESLAGIRNTSGIAVREEDPHHSPDRQVSKPRKNHQKTQQTSKKTKLDGFSWMFRGC